MNEHVDEQNVPTTPDSVLAACCFLPALQGKDRDTVLVEMVRHSASHFGLQDEEGLLAAIEIRENTRSTGTPEGVAFPHGKHQEVQGVLCTVGVSPTGVAFGQSPELSVCRIIVLTLSSVYLSDDHLHVLAHLANHLRHAATRETLMNCQTREAFLRAMGQKPERN